MTDAWFPAMWQGMDATGWYGKCEKLLEDFHFFVSGLSTGPWTNNYRGVCVFYILLVLIGRYILGPYFSAVFLESYLSASFHEEMIEEALTATRTVGKPERKDIESRNDNAPGLSNHFDFSQVSNLSLNDIRSLRHGDVNGKTFGPINTYLSDPYCGWKRFKALAKGEALFLFEDKSSERTVLRYVVIIPKAKPVIIRSITLVAEFVALGITHFQYVLKLEPTHTVGSQRPRQRQSTIVLSAADGDLEHLMSHIKSNGIARGDFGELQQGHLIEESAFKLQQDEFCFNVRLFFKKMVQSQDFETFIAALITLSVLSKALISENPSVLHQQIIGSVDYLFQYLFSIEVISRLTAIFPRKHFSDKWYIFDWLLVISFYIQTILSLSGSQSPAGSTLVTRMQRLVKVAKMFSILRVGRLSSIAKLVDFLAKMASNALGSFIMFLFVLMFSFSVIGLATFGQMCTDADQMVWSGQSVLKSTRCLLVQEPLGEYESFSSVELAMLTLLRVFTGDDWISTMNKCSLLLPAREQNALAEAIQLLIVWNSTRSTLLQKRIISLVQSKLPVCQSSDELNEMRTAGLVDCSSSGQTPFATPCVSNCGSVAAEVYFPLFFFLSNSIVWNLIMSTLIEGLKAARVKSHLAAHLRMFNQRKPIIKFLPVRKLLIVYEVWSTNLNRKSRFETAKMRSAMLVVKKIRYHYLWVFLQVCSYHVQRKSRIEAAARQKCVKMLCKCLVAWKTRLGDVSTENSTIASESLPYSQISHLPYISSTSTPDIPLKEIAEAASPKNKPASFADPQVSSNISSFRSSPAPSEIPSVHSIPSRTVTPDYVIEASITFDTSRSDAVKRRSVSATADKSVVTRLVSVPETNLADIIQPVASDTRRKIISNHSGSKTNKPASWRMLVRRGPDNTHRQQQEPDVLDTISTENPAASSSAIQQRVGVATMMAESGLEHSEKLHVMRRGLAMRPRNVPLLRHYGELLLLGGDAREAEAVFQRALEIDPRDPGTLRAYLGLARAGGDRAAAGVLADLLLQAEALERLNELDVQPTSRAEAEAMLGCQQPSYQPSVTATRWSQRPHPAPEAVFVQPAPQLGRLGSRRKTSLRPGREGPK